eukprot:3095657-Amphidinium_carterae.2
MGGCDQNQHQSLQHRHLDRDVLMCSTTAKVKRTLMQWHHMFGIKARHAITESQHQDSENK